ncbi:hypothetical protein DH2020_003296 [Rehmannia glutinosa]|uniref:Uncharacterized protein n=1 Tax=Rehmannia glutinosa TaxID=99300 RepID=A0ABR0XL68_REHGL
MRTPVANLESLFAVELVQVTGDQLSSIVQNAVNILWARNEAAAVVEAGRTEDRVAPRREEEPMSKLEKLQAEVKEMKKRMSGQDVGGCSCGGLSRVRDTTRIDRSPDRQDSLPSRQTWSLPAKPAPSEDKFK